MRSLTAVGMALALVGLALAADDPYGDISGLKLNKPEDKAHVKAVVPPTGAILLFDGTGLDNWVKADGKSPAEWKLVPSATKEDHSVLQVEKGKGNIITKQK